MFQSYRVEADIVENGHEALELLKRRLDEDLSTYKLILMKYSLQTSTFAETAEQIREVLEQSDA